MRKASVLRPCLLIGVMVGLFGMNARQRVASQGAMAPPSQAAGRAMAARLPLRFEANRGQFAMPVKFATRGPGFALFFGENEAVLRTHSADRVATVLRMKMVSANPHPHLSGREEQTGRSNYLLGQDASRWVTGVPAYARLVYDEMWPGVDVEWYGNQQQLEYDFIVAPGADARQIKLAFSGQRALRLDRAGALVMQTESGEVRLLAPQAWQEIKGQRRVVACRYRLTKGHQVALRLGAYDHSQSLVIDPVLTYATLFGGSGETNGIAVATDQSGNVYLTGGTDSTDWPGTSALQTKQGGQHDAYILKLNASGTSVLYATWLGGSNLDVAYAIAVDAAGNAYIAGETESSDFPKTTGAFQTTLAGNRDGFVAKLNAAGSALSYSSYLGGAGFDQILGLAVDSTSNAYVTGQTESFNFPTAGTQTTRNGAAIYKSSNNGTEWAASAAGLTISNVQAIVFDSATTNSLYAASGGSVYRSTDGGRQWTLQGTLPPLNIPNVVFYPTIRSLTVSASGLYLATTNAIYKSTDAGRTFTLRSTGITASTVTIAAHPATPTTLYALTNIGVFRSLNAGDSWTPSFFDIAAECKRIAFDPTNAQTVYVGTNRGVFKSTNGGATWTPVNYQLAGSVPPYGPDIAGLAHDPVQSNTLYVVLRAGGTAPNACWKTTDGGASWFNSSTGLGVPPLNNITPTAFAISNSNSPALYLGTPQGIWKSADRGATWNMSNQGLQSPAVTALLADSQGNAYAGVNPGTDAFVAKLNASGTALQYSRYLGGTQADTGYGIAVNANGEASVAGMTWSTNLPVSNALQATNGGAIDTFVTKLNATGSGYLFSTYLGGNGGDEARAIALDGAGDIYLTGSTFSSNFPLQGALRQSNANFLDAFVTKLKANGSALVYSTYLGGGYTDSATSIAVDNNGSAWVTGNTLSTDFPTVNALQTKYGGSNYTDAFISRLHPSGSSLTFSTYYGGQNLDQSNAIALDSMGNAYVTGVTLSSDFPLRNPLAELKGGSAFLLKLSRNADLALTKTDARDPVQVNQPLVYTLTVTNNGPDEAVNAVVTDSLPTGVTFVSATAAQGACNGTTTITCTLGNLAVNAQAVVTLTVTPTVTGTLTNRATVTSATPDLNTNNNTASQETRISTLPSIAGRVLSGNGTGLNNVSVALSSTSTVSAATNDSGFYQFAELGAGGNFTVRPTRTGYVFNPPARAFNQVTQDQTGNFTAVACTLTISPMTRAFPTNGGSGMLTLNSPDPQCPWTARSNVPWLTITSATSGNGSTMVSYTVAATTAPRTGSLAIAGNTFTVWQEVNPCAVPDFITAKTFATGSKEPRAIVSADFNQDGKLDVAVGSNDAKVNVLLGEGAGRFSAPMSFAVFGDPWELVSGDFNNDGLPDLAGVNFGTQDNVFVLLGLGGGRFGNYRLLSVGASPQVLSVADFNNDNRSDLAVASQGGNSVSIFINAGGGNFSSVMTFSGIMFPSFIATGDFTGDGNLDVITAGDSSVILPGNGSGGFGNPIRNLNLGGYPFSLVTADFNRDGRVDVATAVRGAGGLDQVAVTLANAMGGFRDPVFIQLEHEQQLLKTGDLNNDGRPDLLAYQPSNPQLTPLFGDGTGQFTLGTGYSGGNDQNDALLADFTGDGKTDILTINQHRFENGSHLSLLVGEGGGKFAAIKSLSVSRTMRRALTADFTGDGKLDLVAVTFPCGSDQCGQNGKVELRAGDGRGEFGASTTFSIGNNPVYAATGDFNNDNRPDLAILNSNPNTLAILLNNGMGGFVDKATLSVGGGPTYLIVGDVNNDNHPDLVLPHRTTSSLNRPVWVLLGNGTGEFSSPVSTSYEQAYFELALADLNGDGRVDLVGSITPPGSSVGLESLRGLYAMLGNGSGGFGPARKVSEAATLQLASFDFNSDGKLDLASATTDSKLAVLFGDGAGNISQTVFYPLRSPFSSTGVIPALALGDFNNDGRPDLALTDGRYLSLELFLGDGRGVFSAPLSIQTGYYGGHLMPGDFNQDGRTDLLLATTADTSGLDTDDVALLLNTCVAGQNNFSTSVSAANYTRPLASEAIAALFGVGFTNTTQAGGLPLPTALGGVSVKVRDALGIERLAPLFFVSPGQINYLIPAGTATGGALVSVVNNSSVIAAGTAQVETVAPGIFTANATGQGVAAALALRVQADGAQVYESIARYDAASQRWLAIPLEVSNAAEQVFLVLFGTGLRESSVSKFVEVGGLNAEVLYAGPQGALTGLDQVNVRLLPSLAGRGAVNVVLRAGSQTANPVQVNLK